MNFPSFLCLISPGKLDDDQSDVERREGEGRRPEQVQVVLEHERDRFFWKSVNKWDIKFLYEEVFQDDFKMFGYDLDTYFAAIGLGDKDIEAA